MANHQGEWPDGAPAPAHRLFPVLLFAFAVAAVTMVQRSPARSVPAFPRELAAPLFPQALRSTPPAEKSLVLVQVADVVNHAGEGLDAVLLIDGRSEYVLPVFVDSSEGDAIRRALEGVSLEGPGTYELLHAAVRSLGAEVSRVEVFGEETGLGLRGRIVLERGPTTDAALVLDARAGDAVALALATRSPLFASGRVLEEMGIRTDALPTRRTDIPSQLKAPASL